ncbi:MAG: lipoate--protein ligase family protein [Calditrichaeota bacterium]|nr:lipoate--protein ligase family protein [Calditrichota bacterium]
MYLVKTENIAVPAINLAIEEYLVRKVNSEDEFLYLYVNEPSVIIGKHQNPFEEVNLNFCRNSNINVYRRISGGGTVYHDKGNLNFCYITQSTQKNFNVYKQFLTPIVEYLNSIHVKAEINSRNDLIIGSQKISGNAQFTSRKRMLSHGTLLFNADLQNVSLALKTSLEVVSKSTKSYRSPVTNISAHLNKSFSMEIFKEQVEKSICKTYKCLKQFELSNSDWNEIKKLARSKYISWDWNYGLTPPFSFIAENNDLEFKVKFEIRECKISGIEIERDDKNLCARLWPLIKDTPFEKISLRKILLTEFNESFTNKIIASIYPF